MPIKINGATSGSTTITAPATGSDETIELSTALASKLDLAGGKILQIVRATDSTTRTTTSLVYVDASLSVTITPQKNDSAILVLAVVRVQANASGGTSDAGGLFRLATSAGVALSGGGDGTFGSGSLLNGNITTVLVLLGRHAPATTSAVTYKMQFASNNANTTITCANVGQTAQIYAIEVSA